MEDQECHIQAEKIKSKLGSVVQLLKFLEDRSIFAGFPRAELEATKQFLRELKNSLRKLVTKRTTQIRQNKSKIYLETKIFERIWLIRACKRNTCNS